MRASLALHLLARLACFLPLIGVLVLADWMGTQSPLRPRAQRNVEQAADQLIAGRAVWSRIDSRELKSILLRRTPVHRDVLVLGSSRAIQIAQAWFQPQTLFNGAIFAGDLDDMLAVFELCVESGKIPRTVILELNPNLRLEKALHPLLAPYFRRALLRYRVLHWRFFSRLLMLDQIRWDFRPTGPDSWSTSRLSLGTPETDAYELMPDGTAAWSVSESHRTPDEVALWAERQTHNLAPPMDRWRTNSAPDDADMRLFRALLDDLRAHHIRVVALLPPIHPIIYGFYFRRGGYHEDWIRREMARRGIQVVGSFSPANAGATRADFYDDVHPHPALLRRLLAEAGLIQP